MRYWSSKHVTSVTLVTMPSTSNAVECGYMTRRQISGTGCTICRHPSVASRRDLLHWKNAIFCWRPDILKSEGEGRPLKWAKTEQ